MTPSGFLSKYSIYIALAIFLVIVVLLVVFLVIPKLKKEKVAPPVVVDEALKDKIFLALGGSDNVSEVKLAGSRLTVVLDDPAIINTEELKKLGVARVITMSSKFVLMVNEEIKLLFNDLR